MIVYQVRSAPDEGWQDASEERYDIVGRAMLLPRGRYGPRWERRMLQTVEPAAKLSAHDVTIDVWPPKRNGMTVGTPKGVKVMHISGIGVICESERNQHLNRNAALRVLEAALAARPEVP